MHTASQLSLVVKNAPANAGDIRDAGSVSDSGRFPGGRRGNPLQYSHLENPVDRGAWRAAVHRVTERWTRPKRLSLQACGMMRRNVQWIALLGGYPEAWRDGSMCKRFIEGLLL